MTYKIHVYQQFDDDEQYPWCAIRREDLTTGEVVHLREGVINWPEAIVKTLKQAGVEAALYTMTYHQLDRQDWAAALEIPEEQW